MAVKIEAIERMSRAEFEQFEANVRRWRREGTAAQRKAAEEAMGMIGGLSELARIKIAFTGNKIGQREKRLIEVLDRAPGATGEALTRAMGWKNQSWHLNFGTICKERLAPLLPSSEMLEGSTPEETAYFYGGMLADFDDASGGFTLRPGAREALVAAGVLEAQSAEMIPA